MKLTLILSTYNQRDPLAKALEGLERQTRAPDEILIADDGSTEETRQLIDSWRGRISTPLKHLWQPDQGFRKTIILNQSLAECAGDYVVLSDADCVPHRRFIEDHAALAETGYWVQGRRCFVKEPYVPLFEPAKVQFWFWVLTGRISGFAKGIRLPAPLVFRDQKQRGIVGCNLACWREDAEAINGFDEDFAGWGMEDSDFGSRLYHLGRCRKFVYGHAIVYHLNHPAPSKFSVEQAKARLAETLRTRRVRCERGLAQHVGDRS